MIVSVVKAEPVFKMPKKMLTIDISRSLQKSASIELGGNHDVLTKKNAVNFETKLRKRQS